MAERPDRYPWLDLLDVDGPFLSRPALDDVYDEAWPPRISNEQREILDLPTTLPAEWDETAMAAVDRLLTEVLGYREGRTLKFNPGTVIHPVYDNAAVSPHAVAFSRRDPVNPRLVVLAGPAAAETPDALDPEAITTHYGWASTAVQRAALAARGLGAELALVTNGYQHLLVWVGSGITGHAWVDPSLYRLDRRLADAFVALLSAASVTTDADTSTGDLLRLSQEKQVDVTEKLGLQVRRAAESLVNAVSRANRNTDGKLLAGVGPDEVYAGVVTVLMRTVFLLNAEERDLISSGDLWDRAYSVSELLDQLDDDHYRHQGVMRRRHGAWLRLLAAARAVHGGVNHSQMNVPAYGGNLFDPLRHPFLEGVGVDGHVFDVGVVDDATVRHVLDLLQRLNGQRLSYRAFSVEQIGQVYESLLDHSAVSVPEGRVVLGFVGAKGAEPEVELADLEEQHSKGKLADWLAKNHDPSNGRGKVAKWQSRIDRVPEERVTTTLAQACHGSAETLSRVETFASLLRTDARGVALVFLPGDVYVTETANRRDTGTAYTSPELAAEIAHYALEHLVYEPGPHNEQDESKWKIKEPEKILEIRACDPAVGSGAILVAAARYLADRLVESRLEHGELTARELETAAADPLATDPFVQARRDVVSRCIYAVDRDPMAVEMAKLSLWLVTMASGRPFTFLDHAIKCGDSLFGITSLDQLRRLHLNASAGTQIGLDLEGGRVDGLGGYFTMIDEKINQAMAMRSLLNEGDVVDAAEASRRADLNNRAQHLLDDLRLVADALTAVCYVQAGRKGAATETALRDQLLPLAADLGHARERLAELAQSRPVDARETWGFFHWALEYPEVISAGGFDAMIGNPPFQGGKKIRGAAGATYREYLIRYCAHGDTGSADLVAYFFRRAADLARGFGFLATNTVAQGDTKKVSLRPIVGSKGLLIRARSSERWPGREAVFVSKVWWADRTVAWSEPVDLDGRLVGGIEADLWPSGRARGEPLKLPNQTKVASPGVYVLGDGFMLSEAQAEALIAEDERNREVVMPFANGSDLNSDPQHAASRWCINFGGMEIHDAQRFGGPFRVVEENVKPMRDVTERKQYRDRWWRHAERRLALSRRLAKLDRTIAIAQVSSRVVPVWLDTSTVASQSIIVIPWDDPVLLGVITSTIHRVWVDRYTSTMKTDISYSPTAVFDTFPVPGRLKASEQVSADRLEATSPEARSDLEQISDVITDLYQWRRTAMIESEVGITKLYGSYHDESDYGHVPGELRRRHVELDLAVRDAYGWSDLDLEHGFHDTRYGRFFTVSTDARFELLMRLLELNFQQFAEQTGLSLEAAMSEAQQHV